MKYDHHLGKMTGCSGFFGGILLPSYVGIERNHDKDPYSPTGIMESQAFFFDAQLKDFGAILVQLQCRNNIFKCNTF